MKKILVFVLVFSIVVSLCSCIVFGKEIDPVDNDVFSSNLIEQKYADNQVLIGIADTIETRSMSFCCQYSEDFKLFNEVHKDLSYKVVAEPVESIVTQLGLDIPITSVKLLNPSVETSEGKYRLYKNHNSIFAITIDGITVENAIKKLKQNPLIECVEPNYYCKLATTPNDPYYNYQYALSHLSVPDAWNTSTGNASVTVGIIDDGIDSTHSDLSNNIWVNPYYCIGIGCTKCSAEYDLHGDDFVNPVSVGDIPTYDDIHGTHVAGIIGASGNNGTGVSGINWNVSLAWLKCSNDNGDLDIGAIIMAVNYAEAHNIPIINCSFEFSSYNQCLYNALSGYSGLVIAAAGNDSKNTDYSPVYPACYELPNIISVASTDSSDNRADTSNFGKITVDVAAPGKDILSTLPENAYDSMSGTSMACAQVSGIAALIKAAHPFFTTQQIKAAICGTVKQQGKTYNIAFDGGIVDASTALGISQNTLKSVTFNYNYTGANVPSPFVDYVVYGKKVTEPLEYPHREGYTFDGWYTTSSCTTQFDFNTSIYYNRTVYAKWIPVVNATYGSAFPDYKFRNFVLDYFNTTFNLDRDANSNVFDDLLRFQTISSLDISGKGIHDISGISYFTGLLSLDCSENYLSQIIIPSQVPLHYLDVSKNHINSFNVNSYSLQELDCSKNDLSTLNVSIYANLTKLDFSYNNLTAFTSNPALEILNANQNKLTKLVVSSSPNLESLYCNANSLTVINTIGLNNLVNVDVSGNNMNAPNDVIGYNNWNLPAGVFLNQFSPQQPWLENPFADVSDNNSYYKAVQYVTDNNWLFGLSWTMFNPNNSISRVDLALILYNMAGRPSTTNLTIPFTDMSGYNFFYEDAVKWVYNNGNQVIMGGISDTLFSPNSPASRQIVAVVLDRFATRQNITINKIRDYPVFYDDSQIASWAKPSVIKLYEAGIINGTPSYFYPTNNITRAELAILTRKYDVVNKYLM